MSGIADLLQSYIEQTIKQIVDKPEEVEVSSSTSTKAVIIQIKVCQSDCGKIIGKRGRTIESLKVLCLAIKNTNFSDDSRKVLIEVLEDENTSFSYK